MTQNCGYYFLKNDLFVEYLRGHEFLKEITPTFFLHSDLIQAEVLEEAFIA
jgi:hypothetical protein